VPLEHLSAVELLAVAAQQAASDGVEAVLVSPDLGGVKLAERYAARLGLPLAIVHKTRLSGAVVQAQGVVGDVSGKAPIIVDDMVTTGATLEAAAQVLLAHGAVARLTVVATHGLLVGPAVRRLTQLGVERLLTTDSVKAPDAPGALPLQRVSLAPLLAEAIRRLHQGKPLFDLSSQQ
jgi:ribose-phosphate pyrophosphokinase